MPHILNSHDFIPMMEDLLRDIDMVPIVFSSSHQYEGASRVFEPFDHIKAH